MKRNILLIFIFILQINLAVKSQITIGVDEDASDGALLQLKNMKGVTGSDANSTKGLLLPRVWITDLNSLKDIVPKSPDRPDPIAHEGLMVYNVHDDGCVLPTPIRKGAYVWNNKQWTLLTELYDSEVQLYTDQDGNTFRARTFGSAGTWMIENLRVTRLADNQGGKLLTESLSADEYATFAYTYPNMDKDNFKNDPSMGLLYEWTAATNGKSRVLTDGDLENFVEKGNSVQGICPEGWYLPTIAEWIELEQEIIRNSKEYSSQTGLTEPDGGLKPRDPFNGHIKASGEGTSNATIYERTGNHGLALLSTCDLPSGQGADSATGKSLYDGGFSIMLSGYIGYTGIVWNTYGKDANFHTASLTNNGNSDTNNSCRSVALSFDASGSSSVSIRAIIESTGAKTNGGYLSVRCKKE